MGNPLAPSDLKSETLRIPQMLERLANSHDRSFLLLQVAQQAVSQLERGGSRAAQLEMANQLRAAVDMVRIAMGLD